MHRLSLIGVTLIAVALAAVGGFVIGRGMPESQQPELVAGLDRAREAAGSAERIEAVQQSQGAISGMVTYLVAVDAFETVPPELRRFSVASATMKDEWIRADLVDLVAQLGAQLPDHGRRLENSGENVPPDAAAAFVPLTSAELSRLHTDTGFVESQPYVRATQHLERRTGETIGEEADALDALQDTPPVPPAPGIRWIPVVTGVGMVTLAAAGGLALAIVLRRNRELEAAVGIDALTGAENRGRLESRLDADDRQSTAVLMIDLDHFKLLNDSIGHAGGDDALRAVATVIESTLREGDHLYRYGGEEFCVLLPGASEDAAQGVAERIRGAIEVKPFAGEEHLPNGRLTVSIGVSITHDARSGVAEADEALYDSKASGRNLVSVAG